MGGHLPCTYSFSQLLATVIIVLLSITGYHVASAAENRVVCYYTNWSAYRQGPAKFLPDNINPYLCTHLVYAFGGLTSDSGIKPFDKYQDIDKGGFTKFNGLKTYNKALKTLIAIGGWNEGSRRFSALVADPDARKNFIKLSIRFLRQHQFDGLDLDWEYPAAREGGEDQDKENYAEFIKELREAFEDESRATGRARLLLTIAVPAGIETIDKGFDIPSINRDVDFFNILTYDYHASTEPNANHHAPLKAAGGYSPYDYKSQLNIEYTIQHYLKEGADADKLVVGLPTYGRSYTLFNVESTDVGAPASGPGTKGKYTKEPGYLAYYEICEGIKAGHWRVENENSDYQGPHAINNDQWVGYDDTRIVAVKAKWVREQGLGGIMFWSVDNDDFRGACHGKPFPLIEAAKEAYYLNQKGGSTRPNSRLSTKNKSSGSNRLSRFTTTPSPPSTTTGTFTRKNKKPKNKNSRRKRPKTRATTTLTTATTTTSTTPASFNPLSTPEPPTTPDPGVDFECKDEGFFPHPRECKKYFWCLDAPGLGLVAHHFTCPAGLFFNKLTDSCDYARNVPCKPGGQATTTTTTTTTTPRPTTTTTTTTTKPDDDEYYDETEEEESEEEEEDVPKKNVKASSASSGRSAQEIKDIKDLLRIIKRLGGVEELEKYLEENPGVADAVAEFKEEEARESGSQVTKKPSIPNRFTPSATPNRSVFRPRNNNNNSPVIRPLKYTSLNRSSKPPPVSTTTAKDVSEEYEDEEETEEEEAEAPQQTTKPASRFKPKENKQYVTLNRNKQTSSTETSVVVRYSQDETLIIDQDGKSTTDKPYVTVSRPYARVSGESQVQESNVNTNRLRYVSLSRRPTLPSSRQSTSNDKNAEDPKKSRSEEPQQAEASKVVEYSEEDTEEEEEDEEPASKSTSAKPTTASSTTTEESTSVSTARPRLRIPTRRAGGFNRSRSSKPALATTTEKPAETTSSARRSRAFAVGNRRNLLSSRRGSSTTSSTTTTTEAPEQKTKDEEEEEADERVTIAEDDGYTNPATSSSYATSPVTRRTTLATIPTQSTTPFTRIRGRQGQYLLETTTPDDNQQRQRPRIRQRQRTTVSTTSVTPAPENAEYYPRRIRTTLAPSTLSPLSGSQSFQTAIIRRRTRLPTVATTTPAPARRTTLATPTTTVARSTTTADLRTTTPVLPSTRYAPYVTTTVVNQPNGATDYYYYYYDDEDEPSAPPSYATRTRSDDLLQKSQSANVQSSQFSKRTLELFAPTGNSNKRDSSRKSAAVPLSEKIRLDEQGNIYCLDKGIFPHPTSCKKFVHCVQGGEEDGSGGSDSRDNVIRGWIYSCPEQLSFDVIGGMCNWGSGNTRKENGQCI